MITYKKLQKHSQNLAQVWGMSNMTHRLNHGHGIDKYLDTLLANQTAGKASPPIIPKVTMGRWRTTRVIIRIILPNQSQ